ncbi:hypothetical protein [Rothia nasimurium]|uniref:hypothetical protein n=2 Tax=Rothia nasimurium TaxID=85336 RepID=UPI001F43CF52|nr:hypothetical protein [Rothia nasimurium]
MTDFAGLKDWFIVIAGNLFIVIMIARALGAYAKRDWGDLITNLAVAVVIGFLVYANDSAVALIKHLANLAFGGS